MNEYKYDQGKPRLDFVQSGIIEYWKPKGGQGDDDKAGRRVLQQEMS